MVRKIFKADSTQIRISLPEEFIGKTVELLVFTIDENESEDVVNPKSVIDETTNEC